MNKITKKQPFPQIIIFCVLLFLNTSTAIYYNISNETWIMIPIRLGAALINGAGITVLSVLALHYIHKFLHINLTAILIFISWLILVIESFLLANFYTLLTPSIIFVILDSNKSEASEFFMSYFDTFTWIVLLSILISSIIIFHFREKLQAIRFPVWLQKKIFLIPVCIFTIIIYAGFDYYVTQIRHMTSYQALTGIERIWHSTWNTLRDRKEYEKYIQLAKQDPPTLTVNQSRVPYVVIILGESLSKLHMNAYGYQLPTTPKLNKRIKEQETFLFENVVTSHTITSQAVRQIMSFYDDDSKLPWYQYHTLPSVMKEAGYYTYWISNQDSFTAGDENSTAGIAFISDKIEFTHQRHASEERYGYFDEEILPILDKELEKQQKKAFFCLHLMGSHRRYTNRYPAEFAQFGINDITKNVSNDKKLTIAEYDNSVLYNDYVCDEIIQRFQNKDAIVFYFSDHGEEVYDTRNMCGHSQYNPSKPMKEVPLLIWVSSIFKDKHPDITKQIQNAEKKNFNTTNIIHTIMDICGIQTEQYQPPKSLLKE